MLPCEPLELACSVHEGVALLARSRTQGGGAAEAEAAAELEQLELGCGQAFLNHAANLASATALLLSKAAWAAAASAASASAEAAAEAAWRLSKAAWAAAAFWILFLGLALACGSSGSIPHCHSASALAAAALDA